MHTESSSTTLRRLAALFALAVIAVATQARVVIELRPTVRLAGDTDATLGAIARVTGDRADRLSAVVIVGRDALPAGVWTEITPGQVREALDAERVNWSKTILRGAAVRVRAAPDARATPKRTTQPPARNAEPTRATPVGPTLGDRVAPRIAADLGVSPADLRLTFEPGDHALLSTPTTGRRIDLTPTGRGARMLLRATVYEQDRIVAEGVLRVVVEVRREVAVLGRNVRRGERLASADLRREHRWLPADADAELFERAVGAEASGRLREGAVLRASDLVAPAAIERGDRVVVHALSGAFVVRTEARALGDGAEGEIVEFESAEGRGRRFHARVAGPGRAVLLVNSAAAPVAISAAGPASTTGRR